nr:Putative late blight resistance protein, identical [Solanum demissum]
MANLQEMLCLLRDNLIHLPILDLEFHLQDMDSVIVDAGLLIYSLYDIKGEKEDTVLDDMNQALGFDLPRNIEPIKAMVYLVMQKAFHCNLPRIHGLGYVDFLLKNLNDFQGRYSDSLAFLKNQLQVIQTEFESLQPFLKVVAEEPHNKLKTLNEDCATQIIRKAYEVEYVVDACINKETPHWCLKNLRKKLLNGTKGKDVISIHGMPGLVYSYKDLLLALLRDAIGEGSVRRELHANELSDMLRKTLLPRRYLILVDDVWENSVWDDLRGCFPDANNRSRIFGPSHPMLGPPKSKLPTHQMLSTGREVGEQVANNLGTHIHNDSRAIVDQSYHVLPCHLKSCFLYFGAFLEDRVIDISRLIRLWISEAFIKSSEGRSLEDIAEGYLENLIGRNLVMVTQRAISDGKVKACRLHDVLLDFCKERAAEENFLLWIKRDQTTKAVYSHKQHAHLAFTEMDNLVEWSASCSLVGSVLFKSYDPYFACRPLSSHAFAVSHILLNFKFLKVLDLEHQIVIDFIPTELPYLRYFSALIDQNSIPSSKSNLWNLETLILKRRSAATYKTLLLPSTVWDMVKLIYLYIPNFSPENKKALFKNSPKLDDLETLSNPYFARVEDYLSETVDHLKHLEVLELYRVEFGDHGEWKVSSGKFPKLKILKLDYVSLMKWIVADDAFPNLEQLVSLGCQNLMEIPSCFTDILSLKYIEVDICNKSVVKSAKYIQETQVEYNQNTNFKLVIIKKLVLKFDRFHGDEEIRKRLSSLPGIKSISINRGEKKLTVGGDVDADEVRLVVGKLNKRDML